jgi:hypothetical protein
LSGSTINGKTFPTPNNPVALLELEYGVAWCQAKKHILNLFFLVLFVEADKIRCGQGREVLT